MERVIKWDSLPTPKRVMVVTLYADQLKCNKSKLNRIFNLAKPDMVFGMNEIGRPYFRVKKSSQEVVNRLIKQYI